MDLASFSDRNGAFYVPAFEVRVGGQALMQTLAIGVSQAEVDLTLSGTGRFSFTVVDTFDDKQHAFVTGHGRRVLDVLRFGAQVEIRMGYGERARLPVMLAGVITEIGTSFSEGGSPELTVSGADNLFPMTLGKKSDSWKNASDSDVVSLIAKKHNLATDIVPTKKKNPQVEQNQESELEFIKKLAARNHYEFYIVPPRTLRFAPPRDRDKGILKLTWGRTLLSFKPEANLAAQVSSVEVYGWDEKKKKPIVGKAVAGGESGADPRRKSGGERVKGAVGKAPVLQVRQPVFDEADAKRRAEAILNDHAKKFLTGEAECIGLPDLIPDRNVELENLGEPFSQTYYIHQTTHKVDSGGYRTRFKIKEPSA